MPFPIEKGLDIGILVLLALAVWRGWSQGLVMKAAQLGAVVAACIIAGICANLSKGRLGSGVILPLLEERVPLSGMFEEEIASVADNFAWGLVYFVSFLAALLVLRHVIKIFGLVEKLPVIGTVNRLGGAVVGFTLAFVLLYVACRLLFQMLPQAALEEWGLTEEVIEKTCLFKVFIGNS